MWAMAAKEFSVVLRDRGAMLTLFLSPIAFIVVMSLALGQSFAGLDESDPVQVLAVDEDGDEAAETLLEGLSGGEGISIVTEVEGHEVSLAQAERLVRDGEYPMALIIPSDYTDRARDDGRAQTGVIADPSASSQTMQPLEAAVSATSATVASRHHTAELLGEQVEEEPDPERREALQGRIDDLSEDADEVLAQADVELPSGSEPPVYPSVYQQNVPGYTIMYVFFIVTTMAGAILTERREGTFPRLLSAPVPRWRLLVGKIAPYLVIALAQVGLLTAFGNVVFGMELGDQPLALVPVTLALALCAVSLGVLLAAYARTDAQVSGLGTILILVLAALGGCMVPLVFMPDFMSDLAAFTPHGQALIAFQDVMVRGAGVMDVLPATGVLTGVALLFFLVALPRFRFRA